jgi:hypothetical protein
MKVKKTISLLILFFNCLFSNFIQANQHTIRSKEIVTEHGTGHGISPPKKNNKTNKLDIHPKFTQ